MDSIAEPSAYSEEMDSGQEVTSQLVKALRDAAYILAATEETLDEIAFAVKPFVIGLRMLGI